MWSGRGSGMQGKWKSRRWELFDSNPSQHLTHLEPVVGLDALLYKHAAGGRGEVNRNIARHHFDQTISFDDALPDAGMPGGGHDQYARQIEIGESKLSEHKVQYPSHGSNIQSAPTVDIGFRPWT